MNKRGQKITIYICFIIVSMMVIVPFYLCIVSSFKTQSELSKNFFGIPVSPTLDNYINVLNKGGFGSAVFNTTHIALVCLVGFAVLLPMMGYAVSRRMDSSKFYSFIFYYMLAGIFVPFQVKMIPMIKLLNTIGLANKYGLMLQYLGSATCEGLFLISGFLSSVPRDMEEAAYIDGATTLQTFSRIMYPIMRPIIATVVIRNSLMVWNDFLLPNMLLRKKEDLTLTLFQNTFQGEFSVNYPLVFASFVLSMLPMMIFYVIMQKNIIGGMTAGAVKG